LEAVIKNLHETYQCRMYSRKLLMMKVFDDRFQEESGLTDSAWKRYSKTYMKLTSAEGIAENS
jgi:hypothetical protein